MLSELKSSKLLDGARGRPKGDKGAAIDLLLSLSRLALDYAHELFEIDVNPVKACWHSIRLPSELLNNGV